MAFLLRVELPDVPGSLGTLASALGTTGADIQAIEIVEHSGEGKAVDDVLLELPPSVLPDALVSACHRLDGVRVLWISRYNAGASLRMDLEVVEAMTQEPARAIERLVELVPQTFRCDWAMAVQAQIDVPANQRSQSPVQVGSTKIVVATGTAPDLPADVSGWFHGTRSRRLDEHPAWEGTVLAAAPLSDDVLLVFGRRGGPEVLASELARLGHLSALATTIGDAVS
ncbi:MAG: amino acid-binding protein [Nocardioidaceae bacterium]|jgi:hypothetical protein|nr:amino acid-binding protein [Nocardioidaceae bacterium]